MILVLGSVGSLGSGQTVRLYNSHCVGSGGPTLFCVSFFDGHNEIELVGPRCGLRMGRLVSAKRASFVCSYNCKAQIDAMRSWVRKEVPVLKTNPKMTL